MISIKTVYNTLKSLANKEQRGFVTPTSFNAFAQSAQMNVYNDIMNLSIDAKKIARADVQGPTSAKAKAKILEAYYAENANISLSQGIGSPPGDMSEPLSAAAGGGSEAQKATGQNVPASFVFDRKKLEYLNNSSYLGAPNVSNPVVYITNSELIVLPTTTSSLYLNYLRLPGSVTFNGNYSTSPPSLGFSGVYTSVGNDGVTEFQVDDQDSLNFDLPDQFLPDVVAEMAKMIGIQLGEMGVFQYGNNENVVKETPKTK